MATRNSAREGHPTSAKGVTQSKAVSLPSPRQAMALLLLQATRILESLERRRVSDVDWNDQDLNVDLSVLLALDGCRVLEQEQDPDAFCDKWRQIGAVLSMARRLFTRPDCDYAFVLGEAVSLFDVAPQFLATAQEAAHA